VRPLPRLGAAAPRPLQMAPVRARRRTERTVLSRVDRPCTTDALRATCIAMLEVMAACRRSLDILGCSDGVDVIMHKPTLNRDIITVSKLNPAWR
jgi:hypothetical protein